MWGGGGRAGGGGVLICCLSYGHLTVDYASLSRRCTVPLYKAALEEVESLEVWLDFCSQDDAIFLLVRVHNAEGLSVFSTGTPFWATPYLELVQGGVGL